MTSLMRRFAVTLLLSLLPAAHAAGIGFGALVDQLNPNNKTKLQLKETWKQYKGQEVTWSGSVVEVKDGKHGAKVYILESSRKHYKGYNVVMATHDKDRAAKLKRGQSIRFKGALHDFDNHNNGSVSIDLRNGGFL
jgi:hypothetical protein